jgi:hypothetical protein
MEKKTNQKGQKENNFRVELLPGHEHSRFPTLTPPHPTPNPSLTIIQVFSHHIRGVVYLSFSSVRCPYVGSIQLLAVSAFTHFPSFCTLI